MNVKYVFTSVTRVSNLREVKLDVEAVPRGRWRNGDYIVGEVTNRTGRLLPLELSTGRMWPTASVTWDRSSPSRRAGSASMIYTPRLTTEPNGDAPWSGSR